MRLAAMGTAALGLVGVPLGLIGQFRPLPVIALTALLLAALVVGWRRWEVRAGTRPGPVDRTGTACAVLALLLCLGSFGVNAAQHSSHLLVDGDPAVYAVTGVLLAHQGSLVEASPRKAFGNDPTIVVAGAGYDERGSQVQPQFFHLLPVLLATSSWIGVRVMLWVGSLLGALALLALYAFGARVLRPPWALLATGTVAVLLPQLHFSRDTFSETPSQLLVLAGLAMLWDLTWHRAAGLAGPFIAGLVLGAAAMARVDSFFYLVPIAAALIVLRAGRPGLAVLAGMLVPTAVGLLDSAVASPVYLATTVVPLAEIGVALPALAVVAAVVRRQPAWLRPLGARLALPAGVLVVLLAAYAWLLRPLVSVTRDIPERSRGAITSLQLREHLSVGYPRAYDELTMRWLSWYLGPVTLALGVLGLALLTSRLLRGRDLRLAPFVLLTGAVTAVYVWKPAILPVQYWATRRFLPVSLPGLVLLAAVVCQQVWRRQRVLAGVLAAAVLGFPLALLPGATLPRDYDGLRPAFLAMCAALQPTDVVLLAGGPPATTGLPQAVTGYCHVPAAAAGPATKAADVTRMAAAVRAQGRRLVLLSSLPDPQQVPAGVGFRQVFDVTVPTTALSLSHRPHEVYPYRLRLFAGVP